jgi:hypothetical protein
VNRKILLFCALTTPVFLFAVIAESLNYQELNKAVRDQSRLQSQLVEKNQILEAGINVLASPNRIDPLARSTPGLKQLTSEESLKIRFVSNPQGGEAK